MRYSAAVFDMDGTILDTLDDITVSVNFALAAHGLPARTAKEVRKFLGNGIRNLIDRSVPAETPVPVTEAVFADFKAHYKDHCADRTAPYAGLPELLRELRALGVRTAVVSNKADFAVQELCRTYFEGCFDFVIGEREGMAKKPAPDMVEAALAALDTAREAAVFIGDSEVDYATARNAGLDAILVTWGFRDASELRTLGARTITDTPEELKRLILS